MNSMPNLYTSDQLLSIATYTAYLTSGYDGDKVDEVVRVLTHEPELTPFQDSNGHTGVVYRLAELAVLAFKEIDEEWISRKDFPGVVEYEIIEPMGKWFRSNSSCTDADFMRQLRQELKEWFDANPADST